MASVRRGPPGPYSGNNRVNIALFYIYTLISDGGSFDIAIVISTACQILTIDKYMPIQ